MTSEETRQPKKAPPPFFTLETLESAYFEGQDVWIRVTPHRTQEFSAQDTTQFVYGTFVAITDTGYISLPESWDCVRFGWRISTTQPSVHRLMRDFMYLDLDNTSILLSSQYSSDTIRLHIVPTPDSLLETRFVMVADVGHKYPNQSFPVSPKTPTRSAHFVWTAYINRLLTLRQGYPYRAEGFATALEGIWHSDDTLSKFDSLLVRRTFKELVLEQPWEVEETANRIKYGWLKNLPPAEKRAQINWFIDEIPDTAFARIMLTEDSSPWPTTP